MKVQPLNRTALLLSWERPSTIYHSPITSYMVSYSWVKSDVANEKTFTKTGDQSMVSDSLGQILYSNGAIIIIAQQSGQMCQQMWLESPNLN